MAVLLETSLGDIVIDIFADECPKAAKNFLKLCKIKYYNNNIFFDVQKNFLIQSGDPTGTGRGGESVYGQLYGKDKNFFPDEIKPKRKHKKYMVAMANKGPDTNTSQFYIVTHSHADYLDGKHTIIGKVSEGMEVVDGIDNVFVDDANRPLRNVRIRHTIILDDPFPDPDGLEVPDESPAYVKDKHDIDRVADDDFVENNDDGKTVDEVEEELAQTEQEAKETVLKILGDIPDAPDVLPPDNVLFVCKLNPVTRDEDMELIFSRFGEIKECEIIKDRKTGDSLQYAFIEFSNSDDCEQAYFKMDNVLIDDRRIKVDFSQSVSKLWNSWRRGDKDLSTNNNKQRRPGAVTNNLVLKSSHQNSLTSLESSGNPRRQESVKQEPRSRDVKRERGGNGRDGRRQEEGGRDRRKEGGRVKRERSRSREREHKAKREKRSRSRERPKKEKSKDKSKKKDKKKDRR